MKMQVPAWQDANQAALSAALTRIHALLRRAAGDGTAESPEAASPPALETLCTLFDLSPFERDVLLLCAGMELESRFAEACAAVHGTEQCCYPTFALALAKLPEPHWSALAPGRPLRRWRLVSPAPGDTVAGSALRIDERILHFLAGVDCADGSLAGLVQPMPEDAIVPRWIAGAAEQAARALRAGERVALSGRAPSDRMLAAAAALRLARRQPWRLRIADIPSGAAERETLALHWNREALLAGAGLYVQADGLEQVEALRLAGPLLARLESALVLDAGEYGISEGQSAVRVALPEPDAAARRAAWVDHLGPAAQLLDGALDAVARQFRLDTPTMAAAGTVLRQHAAELDGEALHRAAWRVCREHARRSMEQSATRIEPKADWDSLVLPEAQLQILRQIALQLRHRTTVLEDWGFADKYSRGLGLTALFSGGSGTGKTLAAEVLAHTLDLDLYQIDLAGMVSKYIGETEKNLKRVFDAAEDSGAILLFDEADALFGKRTEVKDSHDRYANLEVSYLLQRMEAYRGLAVLTTNMRHAIDPAFLRRIRFIVEFPFPDAAHRARIWRGVFPPGTPTRDLDTERLAGLNVAGGVIRNIAMHAAFLAADAGTPVGMPHLLEAAHVEYGKLGKPLSSGEIGGFQ
jgi:ATPase family associated with various cellular activities (AAA)/Winged helix domain, variant